MMTPLYFPFTIASPAAIARVNVFFEKMSIYEALDYPMQKMAALDMDETLWEIKKPVAGDEKEIAAAVKDFKNWIDLHEDAPFAFLKAQSTDVPFFSDTSVSKIRSDLKKRSAGNMSLENTPEPGRDSVFAARLFLAAAKEHDGHYFDLFKLMASQEKMEQSLYDRIKGEPGDVNRLFGHLARSTDEDLGNAMTEERIKAWSVLLLHDPLPPGVFVTDSPAVMDFLERHGPQLTPVFTIDGLLPCKSEEEAMRRVTKDLTDRLDRLASGSTISTVIDESLIHPAESGQETVLLTVAVIPGMDARKYFSGFAPRAAAGSIQRIETRYPSTVICRVGSPKLS